LGIRFAPSLSTNRVVDANEKDDYEFDNNGAGVRFSAGLTGDFYFGKNYSFYTGLWYTVARSGVKFTGKSGSESAGQSGKNIYNIQYVQAPIALKLFTNEVATDMKLYFVLGGTLGVKINEKEVEWETSSTTGDAPDVEKPTKGKAYSYGDVGLLLGMGAEYQMGENTTFYGGLSYNRGLLDVASKKGPFFVEDKDASTWYKVSTGLISLEVGLKF
jgi:hypothetical protein